VKLKLKEFLFQTVFNQGLMALTDKMVPQSVLVTDLQTGWVVQGLLLEDQVQPCCKARVLVNLEPLVQIN
jgi:hypothetical protein